EGWRLANPEDAKAAMAALLGGSGPRIEGENIFGLPNGHGPVRIVATEAPVPGDAETLVYHAKRYALGLGCARGCDAAEMQALVTRTLEAAGIAPGAVACVVSLDLKADESAVIETARWLDVPLRLFSAAELEAEVARLANPSEVVFAEVGCHGVAEGAALAAAGAGAELVVPKVKSANATCALARADTPITEMPGRARGRLSLVGIGPGRAAWRTPEATRAIAGADELVGYGLYIDLLGPLAAGKPRRDFPLGGEEDRCRHALERAGEGRDVALVCSGDAGIYAMGALVFELLDRDASAGGVSAAARRVEVVTAPGISALQAAAARAGAPLGHDFCAISLSDLLTPREDILRRVRAAADGDFVVAFYNPVSKRRRTLLAAARDILLAHRPAETPVLLAASLGRDGESLRYVRLDALSVDDVDMLTVVLVGASTSRLTALGEGPRMYTPRGYGRKIGGGSG
ncbi:MAG: precorrin-3B C(17)-methyltransferase, partial [Paracoccaceae bacterium]